MAKENTSKATVTPPEEATANIDSQATNRAVMAARLKTAQDTGVLTPKMQRGFDQMASYLQKGEM